MQLKFIPFLLAAGAPLALLADFTPIPLDPASFNHDVVVEASAPIAINSAVNATMDGGTNRTGNTWYEKGYNQAAPTTGIPVAGSIVTNAGHAFQMPPDYHVNDVLMVGHNNGGRTPLIVSGTLTLTTPAAFSGLSFLTAAGNGPVIVAYTIHYADSTVESGTFNSLDWFNNSANVFNAAGRVSMGGGTNNVGGNPAGAAFAADINVGNPSANISSIDLSYAGSGGNGNTNNNGRAVIFALSGAKDGSTDYTNTIAVTGFNYDAVVEADGPQTTGTGSPAAAVLTNNVTATMDGGLSKANNCWFEKGYYASLPDVGIPAAGSTFSSATLPATYTMPSTYVGNSAVLLSKDVTNANIIFSAPGAYGALSFLCATANGDTFVPCVVQFLDGSSETNTVFIPDWFNRALPWSYLAFGRVNPNNRSINNTPEQFVNPFAQGTPGFEFRGLGLPVCRLFDSVINITNSTGLITNISLSFTNGSASTRVASVFAVSGALPVAVPPVFGYNGTATPGQPARAVVNDVTRVKAWEGTNTIVLSVTNIAGTGPITYQWKKAPRGGGLHDIFYSIDYNNFANISDGGRVSGSQSSALVISNALAADSADYLVVASNTGGSVTSLVATVMILTTNQSLLVGAPAGDVITRYTGDGSPSAESIDHVIDRVAQKWLSYSLNNQVLPFIGPVGYVVTPVSGSSIVTSMRFFTANDSAGRDPFDYTLEGSNDGSTWVPITGGALKGTLILPTGRNGTGSAALDALNQNVTEVDFANSIGYKSYRVSITNNVNGLADALMQIAEIELLGSLVPNPPVYTRQPHAVTVFAGSSPVFEAAASGYPPPRFQWLTNGVPVPGATSSAFTFSNAQVTDSGTAISCLASNTFATVPSASVTLTVIPAPTQSYPTAVLADHPVGYWRLNEGPDNTAGNNGVTAHDYTGGHDGIYSNAVIAVEGYNVASDPDTAADFGEVTTPNSYVAGIEDVSFARATNASSGGTFSVEAWVYGANQTVDAGIVSKGYNGALNAGTGTGTEQFVLDVTGGDPRKFRFLVRDAAGNGHVAQSTVVPFVGDVLNNVPAWHHLVGVCDQPNGTLSLYVDGLPVASGSIPTTAGILDQPLAMTIGSRQSGGAAEYDNQWKGRIDDVALYNSALGSGQVLGHYYAAQRPPIITLQPTNTTAPENVSVTFYSAAYGAGTLSYQWYLSDGVNPTVAVGGQTSSNLTFTTTAAQNANNYQLVVSSSYGASTSAVAQLTVVSGAPSYFTDLPASDTFLLGHVIQLRVNVGGTAPFTYQWQKNGVPIADDYRTIGSQSNVLLIAYANYGDSGNYQVIASNGQGSTPSAVDAVTVTNVRPAAPFVAAGTGWSLQGTVFATNSPPIMGNNTLEVTSGFGSTARSAFLTEKQGIVSFTASFTYQLTSGAGGADGLTFAIQNDSRGAAALGGGGGTLGYSGITPSAALALNIYDPNTRGVRFLQNGNTPAAGAGAYMPATPVLIGGNTDPIQINVSYISGVLSATFRDTITAATFTTNLTVDLPTLVGGSTAYVGFTGADGGVSSTQVVSNFSMVGAAPPVVLQSAHVGNSLVLSWPATTGAYLKSTADLSNTTWSDVTAQVEFVNGLIQVTITPLTGSQFYRLEVYP